MPTITVTVAVTKTVAALDAATIAAVIQWVQTNIKDKLPADSSLTVKFDIIP